MTGWNVQQHDSFPSRSALHRATLFGAALLAAWLLAPLAGMVHVEGFSASIDSLALHLASGSLLDYDRQFPFNLDYFLATRSGVVVILAALHRCFADAGEWPFRVVMLTGFAGVVVGSVVLVRRWAGVGAGLAVGALLLMPGVSESAFFYNDNVLSSGLAIAALALLATGASPRVAARALVAGLLFGAAVACRSDALVVAPAFLGVSWMRRRHPRALLASLSCVAVGALVVLAMLYAAFGFTLVDSLAAARHAVQSWSRGPSLKTHAATLVFFIGLPAIVLGAIGFGLLVKRRDRVLVLTVAGMPLLYNLVYLGKAWEARSFLPMTPFFAALVCLGARWAIDHASRIQRVVLVALLAIVWIAPPLRIATHDGPREVVGRLWAPVLWSAWQQQRRADTEGFESFARGLTTATLVMTSDWNADRYLHLALQDAGFRTIGTLGGPACGRVVETFSRGDVVVRHLRLHVPFVAIHPAYLPLRYDTFVAACGEAPARTFQAGSLATLRDAGMADRWTPFSMEQVPTLRFLPPVVTEPDGVAPLDGPALRRLRHHWEAQATQSIAADGAVLPALLPASSHAIDAWFAPILRSLHAS